VLAPLLRLGLAWARQLVAVLDPAIPACTCCSGARKGMVDRCDVLAVGAHPDDVDLGCGATVARLATEGFASGFSTSRAGELGTRGDTAGRRREAGVGPGGAAGCVAVVSRSSRRAGCDPDADDQVAAVVGALRTGVPRAVLLPHSGDPHPDHGAARRCSCGPCFCPGSHGGARTSDPPHGPASSWPTPDRGSSSSPRSWWTRPTHTRASVPRSLRTSRSSWRRQVLPRTSRAATSWPRSRPRPRLWKT